MRESTCGRLSLVLASCLTGALCPLNLRAAETIPSVGELIDRLDSPDPFDLARAAEQLAALGPAAKPAIPKLIARLRDDEYEGNWDPSDRVCVYCSRALQAIGEPAEMALIAELQRAEVQSRERAAAVLGQMGSRRAVAPLLAVLERPDVHEAWGVAQALGQIKAPEAVPALEKLLLCEHVDTRTEAATSLGLLAAVRSIAPLAQAAADPNPLVAEAAVGALLSIEPGGAEAAMALLKSPELRVKKNAASVMSRGGSQQAQTVDALLAALHDSEIDAEAAQALHWIDDFRGLEPHYRAFAMKDADEEVRRVALVEIRDSDSEKKATLCIEGLRDTSERVREVAAETLAGLKCPEAVDPLIEVLPKTKDNGVRAHMVRALAAQGGDRAFDAIIQATRDETSLVRAEAATALGRLRDPRAIPRLLELLDDEGFDARGHAAYALAKFDDPRVKPALIDLLANHRDDTTRADAALALAVLRAAEVAESLVRALDDKSRYVRDAAVRSLVAQDETTVRTLIEKSFPREEAAKWQERLAAERPIIAPAALPPER